MESAALCLTLEELKAARDLELGAGQPFRVEQARIDRFAEATDDHQWIHVDQERAAAGPYEGTIAHGFLMLSLIPKLLFALVRFPDAGMVVNYGLDKLRFLSPVRSGAEVFLSARLVSAFERPGGILFRVRGDLRLVEDRRRALFAELLFLAQAPPED